jgi:hypothetical protein
MVSFRVIPKPWGEWKDPERQSSHPIEDINLMDTQTHE